MGARAFRPRQRLARIERLQAESLATERARRSDPGRKLVTAELFDVAAALAHPDLGRSVRDALEASHAAAHGTGTIVVSVCSTCRKPWTPDRDPARALVVFEQARGGPGGVLRTGFLCRDCDRGTDAEVWGRVRRQMFRDYPDMRERSFAPEAGRA